MNPDTNRFEQLSVQGETEETAEHRRNRLQMEKMLHGARGRLMRPDGSPVPAHWTTFAIGELVAIKNYTFKVAYVGESAILFEPVGPAVLELTDPTKKGGA